MCNPNSTPHHNSGQFKKLLSSVPTHNQHTHIRCPRCVICKILAMRPPLPIRLDGLHDQVDCRCCWRNGQISAAAPGPDGRPPKREGRKMKRKKKKLGENGKRRIIFEIGVPPGSGAVCGRRSRCLKPARTCLGTLHRTGLVFCCVAFN